MDRIPENDTAAARTAETDCIHLERRIVQRVSRGVPFDKRPDLNLWICHLPLPSRSLLQCPVVVRKVPCLHGGPYGRN